MRTRRKGDCDLCHAPIPGVCDQPFPVGVGTHSVAGYKVCDQHAARLEAIAADVGIVWPEYRPRRGIAAPCSHAPTQEIG